MAAIDIDAQAALMYPRVQPGTKPTKDQFERIRSFGQALKDVRETRSLSRQEVVSRMRSVVGYPVPLDALAAWETGQGLPPVQLLDALEDALGLGRGEFLRRAAEWHGRRQKHLDAAEKARLETDIALREDGRPPRARRRPKKPH